MSKEPSDKPIRMQRIPLGAAGLVEGGITAALGDAFGTTAPDPCFIDPGHLGFAPDPGTQFVDPSVSGGGGAGGVGDMPMLTPY